MSKVTMSVTWKKYGNGYIGQWIRSDAITGTASFEVSPQGGLTGGWNWSFVHSGYTVKGGARTEDEAKRLCEAAYRGIFESEILGDGRWEKVIVFTDRIRIERVDFKVIVDKFTGDCKLYKNSEPLDNMIIDANQDDGGMIRAAVDWAQSVMENHESSPNTDGEGSVECILFPVEYLKEIEDILLSNGGEGMALTIRSVLDDSAMLKAKPIGWAENEHKVVMPVWDESNPRRHRPIGELLNEGKKDD